MLAAVLLASAAALSAQAVYDHDRGPTFKELQDRFAELLLEARELPETLAGVATVCASADDAITIVRNFNADATQRNTQQDDLISLFSAQVKSMRHRVDAAKAKVMESIEIAAGTADLVRQQIDDYLNGTLLRDVNVAEQVKISELTQDIDDARTAFAFSLAASLVARVVPRFNTESARVNQLRTFVADRECEYGFSNLMIGENNVTFKTNFTSVPIVALQLTGITSHLDVEPHDDYKKVDALGVDKYVDYVKTTGFGVTVEDNSGGSVQVKAVSCSWSACQNLEIGPPQ